MKRSFKLLSCLFTALIAMSCAKDIVDLTGNIRGTVKDYDSGKLIANCMVALSPGGKSVTSSPSGTFEFTDLTPGQYSVSFSKAGYNDEQTTVTVTAGQTTTADALLKAKASFAVSETSYDFGDLEVSKVFYFFNYSDEQCTYTISNIPVWLSFNKTNGIIKASGSEAVTAYVDRSKVTEGSYSQNVVVSYSGKESGAIPLSLKMKKVTLSIPHVSIASSAENIKQNSFEISGSIEATGGSQVISYGHCWNTAGNPTVNDSKTDFGNTVKILTFKSEATGLSTHTTYYVRAYAKNAQGIAYSNVITVTTQDVASDKWDGKIASSFAGGRGTFADPYVIKTGGQLLLAKNYSDKYFELGGNIDLDNRNWLPYQFNGVLDGKGYAISNLYIDRSDDYVGLFSKINSSATVKGLTIKAMNIDAAELSYVGALAGHTSGNIDNCAVIFDNVSKISGKDNVGAITGDLELGNISNCHVSTKSDSYQLTGETKVGGIAGYDKRGNISACTVKLNMKGTTIIGGITGGTYDNTEVYNCGFGGKLAGDNTIGGIAGHCYADSHFYGCRSLVDIIPLNGASGGIIGRHEGTGCIVAACYSSGTINYSGTVATGGIGYSYYSYNLWELKIYSSYSTVTCNSPSFAGFDNHCIAYDSATTSKTTGAESESNVSKECKDITGFLQGCYSEYATYWNFGNTWTWTGNIGGKSAKVSCPKLEWE